MAMLTRRPRHRHRQLTELGDLLEECIGNTKTQLQKKQSRTTEELQVFFSKSVDPALVFFGSFFRNQSTLC